MQIFNQWIRPFPTVIIIPILFFGFFYCQKSEQSGTDRILYWSANNPYEIPFAGNIVTEWNRNHPQSPVRSQPVPEGRSSEEIILAAVVGKTTPDIYSNMWQGDVEAYAQAGVLVALDTIPGFLDFIKTRCDSLTLDEVTSGDGHIYQIPWKINPIMLLYNKKLMSDVGFDHPPANYSEFLQAAEALSKDTDGDGYIDRWIAYSEVMVTWYQRFFDFYPLYLAASHGGTLVEGDKITFNNEHAIQVFQFLKTLYDNNYFPRERLSARSDAFLSSVIAVRFTGPWEIVHAEKFKPPGFEYDFASLPVPDGKEGEVFTYGDPKNIVIFRTCAQPRVAWKFLEFMLQKENDLKFLEMTQQVPRRKNLFQDPYFAEFFAKNPRMIPFAKQASFVRGTDLSPVLKEIFDIISQEYEACVIYGVKTPQEAIEDAARAAQLLF